MKECGKYFHGYYWAHSHETVIWNCDRQEEIVNGMLMYGYMYLSETQENDGYIFDIWRHETMIYEHGIYFINVFVHNYRIVQLKCTICIKIVFQMIWWVKLQCEIVWNQDKLLWKRI